MSDFLFHREYLNQGDIAVLNSDTQCNFKLMDDNNFNRYKRGERHEVYGAFFKAFPAKLEVPRTGYWNLVLDLGGGRANVKSAFSVIKR